MAIDMLRDNAISSMSANVAYAQQVKAAKYAQTSAATAPAKQAPKVAETEVTISQEGRIMAQAMDIAKSSSGIDEKKVATLREQFLSGHLDFNFDNMADGIIKSSLDLYE